MSDSIPVDKNRLRSRGRWVPAFVLFLLLSVRLVLLIPVLSNPQRSLNTDSEGYLDLAESLRTRGTFDAQEHTEKGRTPGYPLFIAAIQSVAGPGAGPIVVAQAVLSVAMAGLLYLLGTQVGGTAVGWAAAFLWALNPNSIFWPLVVLSETLFAALLVACLLALISGLRSRLTWWIALSGVLLGASVLVRPIGIYLIPAWVAVLLIRGVRRDGWRRGWHAAGILAVTACSLVLAWTGRNYIVHHEFFFSQTSGSTLRSFILARALADARGISRSEAAPLISATEDVGTAVARILAENPWSIPKVIASGILRTALGTEAETWLYVLGLPGSSQGLLGLVLSGNLADAVDRVREFLASRDLMLYGVLVVWGVVCAVGVWLGAVGGWLRSRRRLDWVGSTGHWIAALTTLYLVAAPLATGDARFRMPIDPFLSLLSGMLWLGWRGFRRERTHLWGRPPHELGAP